MENVKLALLDMDGTFIDTREVNFLAYEQACGEVGVKLTREVYYPEFGKNYKQFLPVVGITETDILEQVHELKKNYYKSYLSHARVNMPLLDIIRALKNTGYQTALVTTGSRQNVMDVLGCFELTNEFDFIITQEDSKKLKPDPECYLEAMKKAGARPEDTVIFEDSATGLEAAHASGANVMKVEKF